jgi:DNA invertase Pin-like site-specific DNA recombinase
MLIGYARVSKADGSQSLDLQRDALFAAQVSENQIYSDKASGRKDERPRLAACLKALREGDILALRALRWHYGDSLLKPLIIGALNRPHFSGGCLV